jgi:hypothetical protein
MKSIATVSLVLVSAAGLSAAPNSVRGEYIEARTADIYTGACFANSEVGNTGDVAVMGWRVSKGSFNACDPGWPERRRHSPSERYPRFDDGNVYP